MAASINRRRCRYPTGERPERSSRSGSPANAGGASSAFATVRSMTAPLCRNRKSRTTPTSCGPKISSLVASRSLRASSVSNSSPVLTATSSIPLRTPAAQAGPLSNTSMINRREPSEAVRNPKPTYAPEPILVSSSVIVVIYEKPRSRPSLISGCRRASRYACAESYSDLSTVAISSYQRYQLSVTASTKSI